MSNTELTSLTIQASPKPIPAVPPWFGEVAIVANYLTHLGMLTTISDRVRFARKRFGLFEVIDFVAVLIGYALSGERTNARRLLRASASVRDFIHGLVRTQPVATSFHTQSLPCRTGSGVCGSTSSRVPARYPGSSWTRQGSRGAMGSARKTMDCVRSRRHPGRRTTARSASDS